MSLDELLDAIEAITGTTLDRQQKLDITSLLIKYFKIDVR